MPPTGANCLEGPRELRSASAPVVADGLVVVRSGDARIFGFDALTASAAGFISAARPSLALRSSVGVMLAGKFTLAGFPGGKLVAIANNNGASVWEVTVACPRARRSWSGLRM
jgi:outer membrane protein assembly factor BamB